MGKPDGMLLLAIRCRALDEVTVLDVSGGADFYGPGAADHLFTGRDCSRAFSLGSLDAAHLHGCMEGATESEWSLLYEWQSKLCAKYPTVGTLLSPPNQPQPQQ